MNLAGLSIKRPIFITSVTILIMMLGVIGFKKMSIDMLPETSIPVVTIQTTYAGAGPNEIETLISRPIEDEISSLAGIKSLVSKNIEGFSIVTVEFQSDVDAQYAEQQVRDKINIVKPLLPSEVKDPIIRKFDLSASPIMTVGVSSEKLNENKIYEIADKFIKPRFEQVKNVGSIEIVGGRKREIHVVLDQQKLKDRAISVTQVSGQISASGENIPTGKVSRSGQEVVYRGLGQFEKVSDINDILVNLHDNEVPTRVSDLGKVVDTFEDEKGRAYLNGNPIVILQIYRQAGSNTLKVADEIKKQISKIQADLNELEGKPNLTVVVDSSTAIKDNVKDVYETIAIGIVLTIITVFFFLGSVRSTFITALSLPASLIGAFGLMSLAGFTINILTLLALTLAVGLLIDDAIVVIENIYKRMEQGESAKDAAINATSEIQLAVVAITLVVMAVFIPVGMMSGTIGQFFKQFGFTVAFSMAISLFVALTIIPMLASKFGGSGHSSHGEQNKPLSMWDKTVGRLVKGFDRFQTWLENIYEKLLRKSLLYSKTTIVGILAVFIFSLFIATIVPSEFTQVEDNGESAVTLELAPGANFDTTTALVRKVEEVIYKHQDVDFVMSTIGGGTTEANKALLFVKQKEKRQYTTVQFRDLLRKDLSVFQKEANPVVKNYDSVGGATQPIVIDLMSANNQHLQLSAEKIISAMKASPLFKDVDSNSKPGKNEVQYRLNPGAAKEYGINTRTMGTELRAQVEGINSAKFRENGREYDVRVRLQDDQRDLMTRKMPIYIPNINNNLVKLSNISKAEKVQAPSSIERKNRNRYIQITASTPVGVSLSEAISNVQQMMEKGETKLPNDVRFQMGGDAESYNDMATSALAAVVLGIVFIYLILSSLYESFITPITIMISFPLALSGAFYGLYISGKPMDLYAMLGLFMLIGVAGKNGILLVDAAKQLIDQGLEKTEALIQAGKSRLRPILMTSFALIAGTIPVAIGLNAASKTRTSMGVVIIAGVLLATVLTLIAVPALFAYVERFRIWINSKMNKLSS